jgi:WD40 repeat protein
MPKHQISLQPERSLTHNNAVYAAAFSNDGKQLATGSLDNTVKLWTVADGEHVGTLKGHGDGVAFVGYLKDNRIVTASLDKSVKIWSPDGVLEATLTGHQDYLTSAAISRSGSIAASGSFDKTVRLWDANARGGIGVLTGHEAAVQAVALSPDGSLIVSGGSDRSLRLWDVASRKLQVVMTGHNATIEAVAISPQGDLIASGDGEGRLRLWKTDGTPADSFDSRSPRIRSLAFSPDGQGLAIGGSDGVVRFWNVADRNELGIVSAHKNTVYGLAIRQDAALLASAGFDRTIRLWRMIVE